MDINEKKLLVIDGNALVHRAYHAMPTTLYTKNNELVNAVYGFTSMLLNVLNRLKPDYVVCTFDKSGPTFRHELYPKYKEHRKAMDDDLAGQLKRIREIVDVFRIPIYEKSGYEADDMIGSIVNHVKKQNPQMHILLLTGDRDLLQLLDDKVNVVLPGKTFGEMVIYDEEAFKNKYGFNSKFLTDYKALYGDKSDNIPGVYGVGEKSAQNLIVEWGGIDQIFSNMDKLKPALKKKLDGEFEIAKLSKKLATIEKDLPIELDFDCARLDHFSFEEVQKKFLELEFKSLLSKLPQNHIAIEDSAKLAGMQQNAVLVVDEPKDDTHYVLVSDGDDMKALLAEIDGARVFSLDTETDSLDPLRGTIVGISIGFDGKRAYYIPLRNGVWNSKPSQKNTEEKGNVDLWSKFIYSLENKTNNIVAHNLKFDIEALMSCSINLNATVFDTMLAAYLLNLPEIDLKSMAMVHENVRMVTYNEISDKGKVHINDVPIDILYKYACADADLTFRIYKRLIAMLEKDENSKIYELLKKVELPLVRVLVGMEEVGISLDVKYLDSLIDQIDRDIEDCKRKVYEIVGHEFNIGSPKQLSAVIFEELNMPKGRKTKTGYSTDERYFQSLDVRDHEIVVPLRKYKELTKLRSTYILTLPKLVDKNSRIHTSFNQAVASTGRLSSSNPNLQNIPVKTELGNEIRNAFVVDENQLFISCDYSQIELRILAHMSKDSRLMEAFNKGMDIHAQTARLLFTDSEINGEQRRIAKTINFAIIYGISSFGLSEQLGISRGEAQLFINKYFSVYTGVKAYIDSQRKRIEEEGFVESLLGRRRSFPGIKEAGAIAKNAMLREAVNMPIQGTNADIIKIAMINCDSKIKSKDYRGRMLLQVHDELIFEYDCMGDVSPYDGIAKNPDLNEFCLDMKEIMENSYKLDVPIKVDVALGKRWGSLVDIEL